MLRPWVRRRCSFSSGESSRAMKAESAPSTPFRSPETRAEEPDAAQGWEAVGESVVLVLQREAHLAGEVGCPAGIPRFTPRYVSADGKRHAREPEDQREPWELQHVPAEQPGS